jgi:regulator of protease activity HflC (stomatin/prohibitin superfamily)
MSSFTMISKKIVKKPPAPIFSHANQRSLNKRYYGFYFSECIPFIGAIGLFTMYKSLKIVRYDEKGIVKKNYAGIYRRTKKINDKTNRKMTAKKKIYLKPGIHWVNPLTCSFEKINVSRTPYRIKEIKTTSEDLREITLDVEMIYKIYDVSKASKIKHIENMLSTEIVINANELTSSMNADEIALNKTNFSLDLKIKMNEKMRFYGTRVFYLAVTNVEIFPLLSTKTSTNQKKNNEKIYTFPWED